MRNVKESGVPLSGGTMSGALDMGSNAITNVSSLGLDPYTVAFEVEAGAATLGPTAPSLALCFGTTASGLAFDADAEKAFLQFEIPDAWNGASDMTLKIYWSNEAGSAIANTETVKFRIAYRSVVWGTENTGNGTAATADVTYTQSGAGADGDSHISTITIPYSDANQPLTAGDDLCIRFDRHFSADTYANDAVVTKWEVEMTLVGIPNHY